MIFYSPVVDRMPPKHVAGLLGHELAHVFQASKRTLTATEKPEWMSDEFIAGLAAECGRSIEDMERKLRHLCDPVEHDADSIAKRWGFNVKAMSRWHQKNIDWDELPEPVY